MDSEQGDQQSRDDSDDERSGSMKKPWLNPPRREGVGAGRGAWRWAMLAIVLVVAVVIVILVLVGADVLPRPWVYAAIPFAIVAAALARVLTIFKASSAGTDDSR